VILSVIRINIVLAKPGNKANKYSLKLKSFLRSPGNIPGFYFLNHFGCNFVNDSKE
jgi:hypothetical protein